MPMEPNRTRQIIQELARSFNKLASELTADLSYAAREIENLRREVQRSRSSPGKTPKTNGGSKRSSNHSGKRNGSHKTGSSQKTDTPHPTNSPESPKPAHEPGSFVFPQEPFSTSSSSSSEQSAAGNN